MLPLSLVGACVQVALVKTLKVVLSVRQHSSVTHWGCDASWKTDTKWNGYRVQDYSPFVFTNWATLYCDTSRDIKDWCLFSYKVASFVTLAAMIVSNITFLETLGRCSCRASLWSLYIEQYVHAWNLITDLVCPFFIIVIVPLMSTFDNTHWTWNFYTWGLLPWFSYSVLLLFKIYEVVVKFIELAEYTISCADIRKPLRSVVFRQEERMIAKVRQHVSAKCVTKN